MKKTSTLLTAGALAAILLTGCGSKASNPTDSWNGSSGSMSETTTSASTPANSTSNGEEPILTAVSNKYTRTVKGHITEFDGGAPVQDATVAIHTAGAAGQFVTKTDADGNYTLDISVLDEDTTWATVWFTVEKEGYVSYCLSNWIGIDADDEEKTLTEDASLFPLEEDGDPRDYAVFYGSIEAPDLAKLTARIYKYSPDDDYQNAKYVCNVDLDDEGNFYCVLPMPKLETHPWYQLESTIMDSRRPPRYTVRVSLTANENRFREFGGNLDACKYGDLTGIDATQFFQKQELK